MDNNVIEKEILEDLNKLLIKLKDFEKCEFSCNDDGDRFVPSMGDIYTQDEIEMYLENGKLKPDAMYKGDYCKPVKFQENYKNFKLSTIRTLLEEIVTNGKLKSADYLLGKYYTSTCY